MNAECRVSAGPGAHRIPATLLRILGMLACLALFAMGAPAEAARLDEAIKAVEKTAVNCGIPGWSEPGSTRVMLFLAGSETRLVFDLPPSLSAADADAWLTQLRLATGWNETLRSNTLTSTHRRVGLRASTPTRGAGFNRTEVLLPVRELRAAFRKAGAAAPVIALRLPKSLTISWSVAPTATCASPATTHFFNSETFEPAELRLVYSRPWRPIGAVLAAFVGGLLLVAGGAVTTQRHWRKRDKDYAFWLQASMYRLGLCLLSGLAVMAICLVLEVNWRALDFSLGVGPAHSMLGPFPHLWMLAALYFCWSRAAWMLAGGADIVDGRERSRAILMIVVGVLSAFCAWAANDSAWYLFEAWNSGVRNLTLAPSICSLLGVLLFGEGVIAFVLRDPPGATFAATEPFSLEMYQKVEELISDPERLRGWIDENAGKPETDSAEAAEDWESVRQTWIDRGLTSEQAETLASRAEERAAESRVISTFEPRLRAAVLLMGLYAVGFDVVERDHRRETLPWRYAFLGVGIALVIGRFAGQPWLSLLLVAAGAGAFLTLTLARRRQRGKDLRLHEQRLSARLADIAVASENPCGVLDCLSELETITTSKRSTWRRERRLLAAALQEGVIPKP